MYTHLLDRLQRFTSPELCGQWHELLLADFCNDVGFNRDAEQMIKSSISAHFRHQGPWVDGISIHSAKIEAGYSVRVRFEVLLLSDSSFCPAGYSVTRLGNCIHRIEFGCGHPDEAGRMKCQYGDKHRGRYDSFPDQPEQWAIYATRDHDIHSGMERSQMLSTNTPPLSRYVKRHLEGGS